MITHILYKVEFDTSVVNSIIIDDLGSLRCHRKYFLSSFRV